MRNDREIISSVDGWIWRVCGVKEVSSVGIMKGDCVMLMSLDFIVRVVGS